MTDVKTLHEKRNGKQVTLRRVTLTDAVGSEYDHDWKVSSDGTHYYQGDDDPPEAAVVALVEYLDQLDVEHEVEP